MTRLGRLLVIAAALNVTAGAAAAAAQTVMVRNAPPGMTVEALLGDAVVATGTTSPEGDVSLEVKLPEPGEMDANVYVDVCEKSRRVLVVDRNKRPAPAPAGCDRREVSGIFWVRRVNTLVVDVGASQPTMLLVRGSYTPPKPTVEGEEPVVERRQAPIGLALFGGSGLTKFHDQFLIACGNVVGCDGHDGGFGYSFGGTFWFNRWLGAEGGYVKPRAVTAHGGDGFSFDSRFDVDVFTVAAKAAVPAGPARIYGLIGQNFHQSTLTSTETIDGVTQAFSQKTHGWGWLYGGGTEIWVTPKVALYGELSFAQVEGKAEDKGEGLIDDRLRVLGFGVKVRLSR
jgi:opacity protein-like surface antigen